jgi:hypothetical protein
MKTLNIRALIAASVLACSTPVMAGVIDFEGDTFGGKANGFTSTSDSGVHFTDTIGTGLQIHSHQALGAKNLLAFGDDASRILINFDTAASSLSMFFGNDDSCCSASGDRAWLELFNGTTSVGLTSVVMNRNDLTDQSINLAAASFNSAVFWYGDASGRAINLIEAIDNISFTNAKATPAIPEPGMLSLIGIALAGLGLSRRKRAN